ncbi:F-box protein [Hibiscus syriacus]|uniref:F-box protein n=1 Tax=Hibiscus syriacus TaxID=106335 RepID=A0A6A2Z9Q8_HIBSY|nr:F-box protein [Hibiscus syriacus]
MGSAEENRIEDELSYPILLAEWVRAAAEEADPVHHLGPVPLRTPDSPVVSEVSKNLERTLTLVRKYKRQSILRRVVRITSATDFRKVSVLLDASIGDMWWLMGVLDTENNGTASGIFLSLPPIASNDPIISWVWSYIATVQMGQLTDRIEAANNLTSLARDNDRNKKITVEGGIPPLLKLLKESSSPEAQIAAANALFVLAIEQGRVRSIVDEMGVPIVVQVLGDSPMKVQIQVAKLVAAMAEHDPLAQEDFARENVIRPLVTLLSFEIFVEDSKTQLGKQNIHSIVQINKELEKFSSTGTNSRNYSYRPYAYSYSNLHMEGSSRGGNHRKERENEKPEVKIQLKINCAESLWLLAKGSVSNSRRITETKGLLCLAKLVEREQGELQYNCLMAIMEITAAAESNSDLRRAAFKTNLPAAKAVIDQLLRLIKELDSPTLQDPAIKSVGSLARTFPARETRVIGPLVKQLDNKDQEVAVEAAIALQKFACPDNFLCMDHSKSIIEFNGVPPLMRLLRCGDRAQLHGVVITKLWNKLGF